MPDAVASRKRGFRAHDFVALTEISPEPLYRSGLPIHKSANMPPRTRRFARAGILGLSSAIIHLANGIAIREMELNELILSLGDKGF